MEDKDVIASMFVSHFQAAFTSAPHHSHPEVLAHIPHVLGDNLNQMLCAVPSIADIKKVVFSMAPDSAPGLDGFTGHFFQCCWDSISHDVCAAV